MAYTVNYEWFDNYYVIKKVLHDIEQIYPILAMDFETIPIHPKKEKDRLNELYEAKKDIYLLPSITSTGLSDPSLVYISHLSIAWSSTEGVVIVCDNNKVRKLVFDWLVSIENLQIWHNAGFDFKHIYYHTDKFPKNYEDSQLILKCRINHCDHQKALTGLKENMGHVYGTWGIDKTSFTEDNIYNPTMLLYSATDACATYMLYKTLKYDHTVLPRKDNPIDLLPIKTFPIKGEPNEKDFFYRNVAKAMIPNLIKLMRSGIPISLDKVQELEPIVDQVLEEADKTFSNSDLLEDFLQQKNQILVKNKQKEVLSKKKTYKDFYKKFNPKNKTHRTYVINTYLKSIGKYEEFKLEGWNMKDVKDLNTIEPSNFLENFIKKDFSNPIIEEAMVILAKDKARIFNKGKEDKANNLINEPVINNFNPNSAPQKKEFLESYLGIKSETISSRTKEATFPRDEIERILTEVNILLDKE